MVNNKQTKHKKNKKIIQISLNKIKIYFNQSKFKIFNNLHKIDK